MRVLLLAAPLGRLGQGEGGGGRLGAGVGGGGGLLVGRERQKKEKTKGQNGESRGTDELNIVINGLIR